MEELKPYIPAFIAVFFGIFFITFPKLAVLLVVTICMGFAIAYAAIVYRFLRLKKEMNQASSQTGAPGAADDDTFRNFGDTPSFKNVTIFMTRRGKWWISE